MRRENVIGITALTRAIVNVYPGPQSLRKQHFMLFLYAECPARPNLWSALTPGFHLEFLVTNMFFQIRDKLNLLTSQKLFMQKHA